MKLMKLFILTLTLTTCLSVSVIPVLANETSESEWKYQDENGHIAEDRIINIDGYWYYIGADGFKKTGWQVFEGEWYYFDGDGHKVTGWVNDGDNWYYLGLNGTMVRDKIVEGIYLHESGIATGDISAPKEAPDFEIKWESDINVEGVTAVFRIFNWGSLPLHITNNNSFVLDNYLESYNQKLSLTTLVGPDKYPVTTNSIWLVPEEERLIYFSALAGPNRFHARSTLNFSFEYDNIHYQSQYSKDTDITFEKIDNQ